MPHITFSPETSNHGVTGMLVLDEDMNHQEEKAPLPTWQLVCLLICAQSKADGRADEIGVTNQAESW